LEVCARSGRGCEPTDEILYPRNETSGTRKMHFEWFNRMPRFLKLCEVGAEILVMFLGRAAEDKDVVDICETEISSMKR
jgi:hypothetical protein